MKSLLYICAGIVLGTVSCAAQSTPKPAPPTPTVLGIPDTPTPPVAPLAAETDVAADQVRRDNDEVARLKSVWAVSDPFRGGEEAMHTLVLPKDGQLKNQADTEEDLNVMAHILEKAAASRDERNARAVGIYYHSLFGASSPMRNLYLEGYGAIFFMSVNYPPQRQRRNPQRPNRRKIAMPSGRKRAAK